MPLRRLIFIAAFAAALCACDKGGDAVPATDTIASVAGKNLSADDLARAIPAGLSPDDSTAFAKAYIRQWVMEQLVSRVASEEVDMAEIDRLTADYRRQLIMSQYRRTMARQAGDADFSEDSLRAFYDAHQNEFRLERPLLKGVYLKVPDDAKNLPLIRRLYRSDKPNDIDRLEKAALGSAIHYDYFRDEWVDIEQIETRIPLDFTSDKIDKLSHKQPIDFEYQGFIYLLSVSDFLPAGTTMPFEAAKPLVRERLLALKRHSYDKTLLNALYDRALEKGTLTFPSGNPLQ